MRGRKARGPECVRDLPGDAEAKRRLEVILRIIAGELRVRAAAVTLGISTQYLHGLRDEVLQASLAQLTPRPLGRPRRRLTPEQQRMAELEAEVERLRRALTTSQLRTEIAVLLPGRQEPVEKKREAASSRTPGRERAGAEGAGRRHARGRRRRVGRRAARDDDDGNANGDTPAGAAGR